MTMTAAGDNDDRSDDSDDKDGGNNGCVGEGRCKDMVMMTSVTVMMVTAAETTVMIIKRMVTLMLMKTTGHLSLAYRQNLIHMTKCLRA